MWSSSSGLGGASPFVTDMLHITLLLDISPGNLMRGGLTGSSATGRNTRTRTIEAIRE
jgi:hypothetical protein